MELESSCDIMVVFSTSVMCLYLALLGSNEHNYCDVRSMIVCCTVTVVGEDL